MYILLVQESFTLEKYVEKLAQLNPETGLGPLHRNKDKSKPFDPEVHDYVARMDKLDKITFLLLTTCTTGIFVSFMPKQSQPHAVCA